MVETQKFYAETMREALEQVRRALGDDAVVLDARTQALPGAPGTPQVTQVEVWAQPAGTALPVGNTVNPSAEHYLQALQQQVQTVHTQLETLPGEMSWLGDNSPPPGDAAQATLARLAQMLPYSGGIRPVDRPHVVAVVGPNGAGKTTMLARWAWHFSQQLGQSVGVLGADILRVGAPEQLRQFCRPLQIPCAFIYRPEQVADALQQLSACALILLDTPGGSPRDPAHLDSLRGLLDAANPAEVHLVIGADTSPALVREIVQRYRVIEPDQLLLTRLDMAASLVELLPALLDTGLALGYLGSGPRVPQDWCVASAAAFPRFALTIGGK